MRIGKLILTRVPDHCLWPRIFRRRIPDLERRILYSHVGLVVLGCYVGVRRIAVDRVIVRGNKVISVEEVR